MGQLKAAENDSWHGYQLSTEKNEIHIKMMSSPLDNFPAAGNSENFCLSN